MLFYTAGRYHVHELLRQYVQQQLNRDRERSEQLLHIHASYYVQFLADRLHTISRDEAKLNEIIADLDNIYLAWQQVGVGREFEKLPSAIYCVGHVINSCVGRRKGIKIFAPAIEEYRTLQNFSDALPVYAALLTTQSVYHSGLMQVDEAITLLEECQSLLVKYDFRPQAYSKSDPLVLLGNAQMFKSNFENALHYGYQAVENAEQYNDILNSMVANQLLGMTYLALGQLEEAMKFGQLALSLSKQSENLVISAVCADHLGDVAMLNGDPAVAEHYYHEGYRYRQKINQLTNLPLSMSLIEKAKLAQNQYRDAAEWLRNSISLYSTYDDTASLIVPQSQLALCYGYMGDYPRARNVLLVVCLVRLNVHTSCLNCK